MVIELCGKCVTPNWTKFLCCSLNTSKLGIVKPLLTQKLQRFVYVHTKRLTTTTRTNRSIKHQDEKIPDDCYTDHNIYPLNLIDDNRNKSWERAFIQLRRQKEGLLRKKDDCPDDPPSNGQDNIHSIASKQDDDHSMSDFERLTTPTMNNEQLKIISEQIVKLVESQLKERLNPKCSVCVFGSAINGLWTDASDLDICVQIPNVTSRSATIRNLRRIAFLLEPLAPARGFENRFTAKIPLLHWKNERPNKRAGHPIIQALKTSIDISVNNVLAISNSALIGTYVACDHRVRNLILAIKLWARARDLNDRSKGTLGSFALSIMAIHFLQRCNPPILVSIQDLAIADNEIPRYVSGIDVRFTTDLNRINEELQWLTKGERNKSNVIQLLQEFFYYFGWTFTKNTQTPICIRSVDFQYMDTQLTFPHRTTGFDMDEKFMHVDNPFEIGIDVANISFHQRNRLITEIRRAHKILKAGGKYQDILQD
ncbi:Nucleotidyltransferase domain family protein [Babesia bovis T2Bo]|uniref:Poly(A) RNA polymerase mitochondrial-like central palm domain-containing protein n=1 Tax=Babesia bovis TaxID=5865 RepID=A7AR65_BABBO|nr:Nucleotidyltransferase domain family protein [Babesia bovis T2Bo]EDO07034.1 Nucleotidyltransferase domain family protein [Babesia bovis T2Bo]|eukprot:XP_001610602.1 hypothetical protein [Babesia bovis T2Bo]